MNPNTIDQWLGIVQKIFVIGGLVLSAWFFLIKEESSPHVSMVANSKLMSQCILRVDIQAENKGGRPWQIENAIARVFEPDLNRIQDSKNLKTKVLGTQILNLNQSLRIGETASFGFNIKLTDIQHVPFFIIKVAMKITEEGEEWMRIVEDAIPAGDC